MNDSQKQIYVLRFQLTKTLCLYLVKQVVNF